jgi:yecA family protein
MLDFDRVHSALEGLGANLDASEAHGTLCALLLDNAGMPIWLGHILEELPDAADVLAAERLGVLGELYQQTHAQLDDDDLTFEILLPDEADDFGVRLLALSSWCQGYLYGFGVNGATAEEALDEEGRECLSDLLEISKLSHDEDASEAAEQQFTEIVEHLRIVTLMLNDSMRFAKPTLH